MNKKILSLVLALVMVLGTFTTVFAEEAKTEKVEKVVGKDNKIQYVIDKKFVEGYGDGDYGYDKNIKRSEITKLLVFANGNKELSEKLQGSMQLYSDVNAEYWANGVISVGSTVASKANKLPMLNGYPDGTFKPENDVTYAELAKMLVVLVKEDLTADMAKEANKNWATQWMTWATQLGILDDVDVTNSNAPAKRADAFTMLYNALYKMVEFKRIPTNDKVGVLSSLRNDKLVLNQDAEKQTYTITKDTVFVSTPNKANSANVVKVSSINDPDFFLGSLVRIMVNDKNEVSHILELGNPRDMALDVAYNTAAKNPRWEGVAKYTVETGLQADVTSLEKHERTSYDNGYVTLTLKSDKTKVDTINFFGPKDHKGLVKSLSINSDTKVYVANPANNQMREVKDIYEAINLIGFKNYDSYAIPNVYAGYDTDGYEASLKGYGHDKAVAKVVVFNVVTKAQDGEKLRVVNQANFPGNATLENTKGELKDLAFIKNIAKFPYNYGDLYDVIELKWAAHNNNYDVIETLIDHSDTDLYPVVKVVKVQDNNHITVVDRFGVESTIYVGDADIFNAKQYRDLKAGDFLQFVNKNGNSVKEGKASTDIEVLSILPVNNNVIDKFNSSRTIKEMLNGVQAGTANGKVLEVSEYGDKSIVKIDVQFSNWKADVYTGVKEFTVKDSDADVLALNKGRLVKFIIDEKGRFAEPYAYNFESNDNKGDLLTPEKLAEANAEVTAEAAKLVDNDVIKDLPNAKLGQADILAEAEKAVKAKVDEKKVNVKVELVNPKATYAKGDAVEVKVTLTHKTVEKATPVEKAVKGNVLA